MYKDNLHTYLDRHFLNMTYKDEMRRIRVLLPKSYYEDEYKTYPVVYFHDGQNVFFDAESYSGMSWRLISCLDDNLDLAEMIVVAIDNGLNRMDEYSPWSITGQMKAGKPMGGQGGDFAEFVIYNVKVFIDEYYRTKPAREYTAMVGSSGGANISAFMGMEYEEHISRLGIFSLASWIFFEDFVDYMADRTITFDQKVYIKVGTEEGEVSLDDSYGHFVRQAYIDSSLMYQRQLLEAGLPIDDILLKIYAGEDHSEACWAAHLYECLKFLTEDWQ